MWALSCSFYLGELGALAGRRARSLQLLGGAEDAANEARLTVSLDETVPAGCVRVATAHVSTAALGDMFGAISVERA